MNRNEVIAKINEVLEGSDNEKTGESETE